MNCLQPHVMPRFHLLRIAITLWISAWLPCAFADAQTQSAFKGLTEIKAECQRIAKLHVEHIAGLETSRSARRMVAARAEVDLYAKQSPQWTAAALPADGLTGLRDAVAYLLTLTANANDKESVRTVVAGADLCTNRSEQLIASIKDPVIASQAVIHAAKVLYLSQRSMRDFLIISAELKVPGVTSVTLAAEKASLEESLKKLADLPSTPKMRAALEQVQMQWVLLRPQLANKANSKSAIEQSLTASEKLFEGADELFEEVVKASSAFR
jgi:hypothetical protein